MNLIDIICIFQKENIMENKSNINSFIDNLKCEGMIRKLDELGRVVIPYNYRNGKYHEGSKVYLQVIKNYLVITANNESNVGIEKTFDELGRILIVKEIRDRLEWKYTDSLMIWSFDCGMVIKKVEDECVFCKNKNNLQQFNEKLICDECIEQISELKNKKH